MQFHRRARRDRKAFINEQCKETEENNIMGNTRDLSRDIKGTFHAWMGMIKDLTEAEEINKRWQEYIEELGKKGLNDSDNHNSVVTHLEPDILECKVNWALSITMNS